MRNRHPRTVITMTVKTREILDILKACTQAGCVVNPPESPHVPIIDGHSTVQALDGAIAVFKATRTVLGEPWVATFRNSPGLRWQREASRDIPCQPAEDRH